VKNRLLSKAYAEAHRDEKASYDKEYRQANALKIANQKKDWDRRHRNDPIQKLKRNMRRRLIHVLTGYSKADTTFALVGCTAVELKQYLEVRFAPGMSWDNYGQFGWHVDHIRPCASFDLSDPEQQRQCFHFTNLRPLNWWTNVTERHLGR
jgi:hypothetical protein